MFIQNYEDGVLDCVGGTCKDSDTVCYISASGKLVKINMTFFGMLLLKRRIFLLHDKQDWKTFNLSHIHTTYIIL